MDIPGGQRRRRRTDRADERGAVVVEAALVFPLLAMLLVGLFSSALLFDNKMQLTHATREGARYGATIPEGQQFTNGTWASNVRRLVMQREGTTLAESEVCVALVSGSPPVAVSSSHTTEGGTDACFDDSDAGDTELRVQVATRRGISFDAVVFSREVPVTARSTARHESYG